MGAFIISIIAIAAVGYLALPNFDRFFNGHTLTEIEELHNAYTCGSVRAWRKADGLPREMPNHENECALLEKSFERIGYKSDLTK